MSHAAMTYQPMPDADAVNEVLVCGDLASLSTSQRTSYYLRVCESLGLNQFTQPFEYIRLNGKLKLYAKRDATDQLRRIYGISVEIVSRETVDGVYVVHARARTPNGRVDEAIGAVPIDGLRGEALANALMKGETKAKRRVTLSVCGLGLLDESEVGSIKGAEVVPFELPKAPMPVQSIDMGKPAPAPVLQVAPAAESREFIDLAGQLPDDRDLIEAWAAVVREAKVNKEEKERLLAMARAAWQRAGGKTRTAQLTDRLEGKP